MATSSVIREENINHIRQVLASGKEYTAASMAEVTGLSVATCNTLLSILAEEKVCDLELRQTNDVGRRTRFYHISDACGTYTSANVTRASDGRIAAEIVTFYIFGGEKSCGTVFLPDISAESIANAVSDLHEKTGKSGMVFVSVPPDCTDDTASLSAEISEKLGIPVDVNYNLWFMGNKKSLSEDGISVIISADSSSTLVGIAASAAGKTISVSLYRPDSVPDYIPENVLSLLNPSEIIFTGDLITENFLNCAKRFCEDFRAAHHCASAPMFRTEDFNRLTTIGIYDYANRVALDKYK